MKKFTIDNINDLRDVLREPGHRYKTIEHDAFEAGLLDYAPGHYEKRGLPYTPPQLCITEKGRHVLNWLVDSPPRKIAALLGAGKTIVEIVQALGLL